jgi:hypothetical protein
MLYCVPLVGAATFNICFPVMFPLSELTCVRFGNFYGLFRCTSKQAGERVSKRTSGGSDGIS